MSYENDRRFEQKFMPQVKIILGQYLLTQDFEEDVRNCTDLLVLRSNNDKRIVVRGRRNDALQRYPDDFTIRYMRDTGTSTEFIKVMSGLGDIMLYFFVDPKEHHIMRWIIGDLNVFRQYVTLNLQSKGSAFLDAHCHSNGDGTYLLAFNHKRELPNFVLDSSENNNWIMYNSIWWKVRGSEQG